MLQTMSTAMLALSLAVMSAMLSAASVSAQGVCDSSPQQLEAYAEKTRQHLQAQGWNVTRGNLFFATDIHGFGNNPSSPYGIFQFGSTPVEKDARFWFLDQPDGFVWIGCTPPPVSYFSYRSYVITHQQPGHKLPYLVWAPLGDATNDLDLNTTKGTAPPHNFDATTAFITTGDAEAASMLEQALVKGADFPGKAINIDRIPPNLVNMSRELGGDPFNVLFRVAIPLPGHEQAYKTYINTTSPALLLHAPPSFKAKEPFPDPVYRHHGTGHAEQFSLTKLSKAVHDKFTSLGAKEGDAETLSGRNLNGTKCIVDMTGCAGGTADALYWTGRLRFNMSDNEVVVAYGVNHNATGKAVYTNMALYVRLSGVASTNSLHYPGSAQTFDSSLPSELYVTMFARNCGLLSSELQPFCRKVTDEEVPPGDDVHVAGRAYLEPATDTGPLPEELVAPIVKAYLF